jgi:hypothetical protein
MSINHQVLSSALHGEALLRARRPELQPLIDELRELTDGRDDIRVECAGTIAGYWFASPGMAQGHELIAAACCYLPDRRTPTCCCVGYPLGLPGRRESVRISQSHSKTAQKGWAVANEMNLYL